MSTRNTTPNSSESTRRALIEAGVEVFGREGFQGASNRVLADTAGVNQALIGYHFGGKEGLYLAVFESMTEHIGGRMSDNATEVEAALVALEHQSDELVQTSIHCIEKLLIGYVQVLLHPDMQGFAKLILREQLEPTKAFDIMYAGTMGRMLKLLSRLVAIASGKNRVGQDDRLSALMLMGQVIVFRVAQATVTHHMGWKRGVRKKENEQIQARMKHHVRALLTGLRDT